MKFSRVSEIVRRLAETSLTATPGTFLGAESDFLERMEVSRPTFRQAVKIVESDRLITVRKGKGGGLFASRPNAADVIRAPARYLRLEGASLNHIHIAAAPIAQQAAQLAALCEDKSLRGKLEVLRHNLAGELIAEATPESFIKSETQFARLISEMSANPAIRLFMEIGYTFGLDEQSSRLYQSQEDREQARELQLALCDAVLAKDGEIAALLMSRRSALIASWL